MGSSSDQVERLSRILLEKVAEIAQLHATVAVLLARVAELEILLGRNSKNSSMPPSAEGFAKPPSPRIARPRVAALANSSVTKDTVSNQSSTPITSWSTVRNAMGAAPRTSRTVRSSKRKSVR
jgi:hypothetical protein